MNNRWADHKVESMYDKTMLGLEIGLIKRLLNPGETILDAGCGEGEGTLEYSKFWEVEAFDSSPERLWMAKERCGARFFQHDVRDPLEKKYDVVISQRLLINLESWNEQRWAIRNLVSAARKRVVLSEGSVDGVAELNGFRGIFGLPPIPIPDHNAFIADQCLIAMGFKSAGTLGAYYLLTRGVQPALTKDFHWSSKFNKAAARVDLEADKYSRIKVWAYEK